MQFLLDTGLGLLSLLVKVFLIVVPLMMLLEIFREYELLDKITGAVRRPAGKLGFKRNSIYPYVF